MVPSSKWQQVVICHSHRKWFFAYKITERRASHLPSGHLCYCTYVPRTTVMIPMAGRNYCAVAVSDSSAWYGLFMECLHKFINIFLFDLPRGPVLCCNCLTFEDWYVRTILTKILGRKRRSGQCCLANEWILDLDWLALQMVCCGRSKRQVHQFWYNFTQILKLLRDVTRPERSGSFLRSKLASLLGPISNPRFEYCLKMLRLCKDTV